MTLGQVHDTHLSYGQQLCEILSRSNLAVRSYGSDTDFWYVCTLTWSWRYDLGLRSWNVHPWVMDNKCVKYYPDPTLQWWVMARTRIISICALWPWPWGCDLVSISWHTFGSWTTIEWKIIQIHGPDTDFWYARTVTLTLEIWPCVKVVTHHWVMENNCVKYYPDSTLQFRLWPGHRSWVCACVSWPWRYDLVSRSQGHCTSFGHGKHLCEILSRSSMALKSYGPDTDFGYVCTMTLTSEIWPWIKVMTHPWDMDNNCVKYYPEGTSCNGVMASDTKWTNGQTDGRTDRQTDRRTDTQGDSHTPKLCLRAGGIINTLAQVGGGVSTKVNWTSWS